MPEAEQKFQDRQIAYKVRIKDVLNSEYTQAEGFNPNYLKVHDQKISRVNIIGVVVQKPESSNQGNLIIEDGTGNIIVRTFENNFLFDNINIGDVVLLVGRPREFSMEKYLLAEIVKKVKPEWAQVRKLELGEKTNPKERNKKKIEDVKEEVVDESQKNKILGIIKELDKGEGVAIEDISSDVDNLDEIIDGFLKKGDIFEVKPGKLKVLE